MKKKILWVIGSAKFRWRGLQSPCGLSVFVSYTHTPLCILNTQLLFERKKKIQQFVVLHRITSKTEVCNTFSCTSCATELWPLYCHLWLKHKIANTYRVVHFTSALTPLCLFEHPNTLIQEGSFTWVSLEWEFWLSSQWDVQGYIKRRGYIRSITAAINYKNVHKCLLK